MHIHSNPGQRCNAGAPMGRMRSQPISSSILGTGANGYGCPLVISVGIDFGKRDPLNTILKLLEKKRIHDPEALRERDLHRSERLQLRRIDRLLGRRRRRLRRVCGM